MSRHASGRTWGYLGAAFGGLVSIAANTAHSYLRPAGARASWRPPAGAVLGAQFWPLALFVAIEILARTSWPGGKRWVVVRLLGLVHRNRCVLPPVPAGQMEERCEEQPKPGARTARKAPRRRASVRRIWAELLAAAGALNAQALESTGEPASLRRIKTVLRVGQDTAIRLREAVAAPAFQNTPEGAPGALITDADAEPGDDDGLTGVLVRIG